MKPSNLWIELNLLSGANLGRGDGVAGLVNAEVKHDRMGLPYLSGKTLKGLLVAHCAEVLYSLEQISPTNLGKWQAAAESLFGSPGSGYASVGKLHFEDACLAPDLRARVIGEFQLLESLTSSTARERKWGLKRAANLEALTALRRQTAMDAKTGAPLRNTLRTTRVVLRSTTLYAPLGARPALDGLEAPLLAAIVCAFRRMGGRRNRGLGALKAELYAEPVFDLQTNLPTSAQPVTTAWLAQFEKEVQQ